MSSIAARDTSGNPLRPLPRRRGTQPRAVLSWVIGFALLAGALELLHFRTGLPGVVGISRGLASLQREGLLVPDLEVSVLRWLRGWAVGALLGVSLGYLTAASATAKTLLEKLFVLCRAIPFISLVPMSIRLFGLGEGKMTFLVAWSVAGMCWILVHQSASTIPTSMRWRATSLGIRGPRRLRIIVMPHAAPAVYAALRTSLALGWIVVAVAESSGVFERSTGLFWAEGLGYRIFHSLDAGSDSQLLAAILMFAVVGIVGDQIFLGAARAIAWAARSVGERVASARILPLLREQQIGDGTYAIAPTALRADRLSAAYPGRGIFRDLSLTVPAGDTLVVVAPSGAGKTTLLRAIGGLEDEDLSVSGHVFLGETSASDGADIGLVLQDAPVFGQVPVWDHVGLGARIRALSDQDRNPRIRFLLHQFGIAHVASARAETLSGGERQRLALATALANEPRLLLLDEPFGALDAFTRRSMQDYFVGSVRGRVTSIFVTHDLAEALTVASEIRVGLGNSGEIIRVPGDDGTVASTTRATAEELRDRIWAALEQSRRHADATEIQ